MSFDKIDPGRSAESGGRQLPSAKVIAFAVVAVAVAVFLLQNGEKAQISFLWLEGSWPVWIVILISVAAGVVLDRLGSWFWARARRRKEKRKGND